MKCASMYCLGILCFVWMGLGCTKKTAVDTPEILEGYTLQGTRTSGAGVYSDETGYTFKTVFEPKEQFRIFGADGKLEHTGVYRYKKLSNSLSELTLLARSGVRSGSELTITLKFTSSHDGAYEAKTTKGDFGEQTGIFKLK